MSLNNLSLRPNPVLDFLTIDGVDLDVVDIKIYNTAGVLVIDHISRSAEIDVSQLTLGLYILKASDGYRIVSKKFIKLE